jgi:anion-transporting  ArsA/GET3 family ATPase
MPSKQFAHLRRQSTDRLRALVPHDVPIVVIDTPPTWAIHHLLTSPDTPPLYVARRFEVAQAWLQGYVGGYITDHPRRGNF